MTDNAAGTTFEGRTDFRGGNARRADPLRVGIVVSRYNESITRRLLDAAVATFVAAGLPAAGLFAACVAAVPLLMALAVRLSASKAAAPRQA